MISKKKIALFIGTIFLFLMSWGIFQFSKLMLERQAIEVEQSTRLRATTLIHIRSKDLVNYSLEGLIRHDEDADLLSLLNKNLSTSRQNQAVSVSEGLDFLSDVELFSISVNGATTWGVLAKMKDAVAFAQYAKQTGYACSWNKNRGVVLFASTTEDKRLLLQKAQDIVRFSFAKSTETLAASKRDFISVSFNRLMLNRDFFSGTSAIDFGEHGLQVKGRLRSQEGIHSVEVIRKRLVPHHFHCSSSLVPTMLNDSLQAMARQLKCSFPAIRSFSMNYAGMRIFSDQLGMHFIPQLEAYITCDSPIDIRELLGQAGLQERLGYTVAGNRLMVGNSAIYFKQFSPRSFYIGVTSAPRFEEKKSTDVMVVDGNLKSLSMLSGDRLTIGFIEMLPLVQAGTLFSMRSKEVHFSLRKVSAQELAIEGRVSFVSKTHPANELLRFMLIGRN